MKNIDRQIRNWLTVGSMLALPFVVSSPSAFSAGAPSGADTFKAKCAMCHGSDGAGNTPMGQKLKIQDLRSAGVQKQTDHELAAVITNGKPPMPAYSKTLAASDIKQLVAYLRSIAAKN